MKYAPRLGEYGETPRISQPNTVVGGKHSRRSKLTKLIELLEEISCDGGCVSILDGIIDRYGANGLEIKNLIDQLKPVV